MVKHTLTNGTVIEITAKDYCGHISPGTKVNGKYYQGELLSPEKQAPQTRKALESKGYIGYYVFDIIALPPEKGLEVEAMIAAAQAALDSTPEAILNKLIGTREGITSDIRACYEEAEYRKNKSYESGEGTGKFVFAGEKYEKEAETHRAKLNEFDKEHPEVIAEINRRKEEDHKRWLASD